MLIKDKYEIRFPLLSEFPDFLDMASDSRKLATEIAKVSVYRDGELVGIAIPLDDALPIIREIIARLYPTEKNE